MNPWVTRNLIVPIHERLMKRQTMRYYRELISSQWMAPDELRAMQLHKLRQLLIHAEMNTRYYRQLFGELDLDVRRGNSRTILAALPLLDKALIRRERDRMIWKDTPGGLIRSETGGSTGEPLIYYLDRRRQAFDQSARWRMYNWFEVNLGERELYLWGSPIELERTDRIKQFRDKLFNHRLLNAFEMSPERMDGYLDEFDRFKPALLFGYPSSLSLWVQHANYRKRKLNTASLKAVFVTGETCHPHQRKKIQDYFGVPVVNGYGSREGGFIAHECPEGSMHVVAENAYLEIMDRKGNPVEDGQSGEIILTHLDAYAMPMIRYRTGDVGKLKTGRCACGRGLPRLDVIEGRITDFIHLPDGTIKHALSIIYPLREMAGIRQFRVIQQKDFSVAVEVVADNRGERITRDAIAQRVRPVLGPTISLTVHMVDRMLTSESGKHHYVVSHASSPTGDYEFEVEPH